MIHHCTQQNQLFPRLFCEHGAAKPDDVVLLSGGEHLVGELSQHPSNYGVTFAAEPGQKACVVGRLDVNAPHTTIEGLEITGPYRWGIRVGRADHIKVINNRIHHIGWHPKGNGIVTMEDGVGHLYYGNIVWKCGVNHLGHGFYIAGKGDKHFVNNICYENAGFAFHIWSEEDLIRLDGYNIEGNIAFAPYAGNLVIGGRPSKNIRIADNLMVYPTGTRKPTFGINLGGYGIHIPGHPVESVSIKGNGFHGGHTRVRVNGESKDVSVHDKHDRTELVTVNKYKPNLAYAAIFDSKKFDFFEFKIPEFAGKNVRAFNVIDMTGSVYGEPVFAGMVPVGGEIRIDKRDSRYDYEPEFGCYLIKAGG